MQSAKQAPAITEEGLLDEVLSLIRIRAILYGRSIGRAPWGFSVMQREVASFTIVREGSCWLEIEGLDQQLHLEAGDVAVLPLGLPHTYRDDPSTPAISLAEMLRGENMKQPATIHLGARGAKTVLICGGFWFEDRKLNPVLDSLPPGIRVRPKDAVERRLLDSLIAAVENEIFAGTMASRPVVTRWAEVFFIHALRTYIANEPGFERSRIAALRDPRIAKVLAAVHREPTKRWSLQSLAVLCGMSRSAFARHFSEMVGVPAMQYVTRFRMTNAAAMLRRNNVKLLEIAEAAGYGSEAGFSKAFKRAFGAAPSEYQARTPKLPFL